MKKQPYRAFVLLFSEQVNTRTNARERKKYWKSGIGKEKLRRLRSPK
jgi:putative endonuclease